MSKVGRWRAEEMRRLPQADTWEERLALLKATWTPRPFWKLLGMEPVGLGPGYSKLRVRLQPRKHGRWPHGGLLSSMVDSSVGLALYTTYGPEDEDVVAHATADLNISFLDSMQGDELFAEGRIIRKARMAAFGTSEIRDAKGTLIAVGRATFLIRRGPQEAAG
jgi:uncharacterized protein (TIGR00369 family)